jgi:RNA polymerase sigma-B factor
VDHRDASLQLAPSLEKRLFERARRGDGRARETLVHRYLPLARNVARRYLGRGEPEDDLVQVASIALLRAIDRFDVERGIAFASFVVPTIAGELKHYFRDRTWTVRPPRNTYELSHRVARTVDALDRELGRSPTPAEVAERIGASIEDVLDARATTDQCRGTSLDAPRDVDGYSFLDELGFEDRGFEQAADRADIDSLMAGLSPRSREILRLRFAEDLSQADVGTRVGVSQMHVSRLERQAIAQLREAAEYRCSGDTDPREPPAGAPLQRPTRGPRVASGDAGRARRVITQYGHRQAPKAA